MQLRAGVAGDLRHATLDRGMDVLVAGSERERAAVQLFFDPVERRGDHGRLLVGQQADAHEHAHVGA